MGNRAFEAISKPFRAGAQLLLQPPRLLQEQPAALGRHLSLGLDRDDLDAGRVDGQPTALGGDFNGSSIGFPSFLRVLRAIYMYICYIDLLLYTLT